MRPPSEVVKNYVALLEVGIVQPWWKLLLIIYLSKQYVYRGKKVKCTLVQTLRLCTGRTAYRGNRGTAVLYRH